jgi:hypothetical protein
VKMFLKPFLWVAIVIITLPCVAMAQIRVNPDGVNVNSQGSTVVYLTFGSLLATHRSAEGCWCGDLIPAAPGIGLACNPATIFGCIPARFDLSTRSGAGGLGFTDIMSIPPSVARRAYQAAVDGDRSSFFYVRRFIDTAGGPDEFVNVTCRMSGGGPRTPFSLTDVKLSFAIDKPVLLVKADEKLPPVKAEIAYNGTGRLKGRWEVVLPGEEAPSETDLLTEATLPIEERAKQRRYTQLSTFNIFLPPDGKYTLAGPDAARLPNTVRGEYLLLLRIEATDEKEGDSNLALLGVGPAVVHSGAVAGFPLPVLRYYVGSGPDSQLSNTLALLFPDDKVFLPSEKVIEFKWSETVLAAFYRLEVVDMGGQPVLSALLTPGKGIYRSPPWLKDKVGGGYARWRVVALDQRGEAISESGWRDFRFMQSRE